MEFLKLILGDDLYSQVATRINEYNSSENNKDKQVKIANLATGDYVDKMKYTAIETKLNEANATITDLKKNNKDNEELQKTIKEHETKIKELETAHKTEIETMLKQNAIKEKLYSEKAKYPDLLLGKFDLSKVSINADSSITGIDEQLATVKETYSDLIGNSEESNLNYIYAPKTGNSSENAGSTDFASIIKENSARK